MKTYSHSRQYGYRVINWRTLVISCTILACFVVSNYTSQDKVYIAEKPQQEVAFMVPVVMEVIHECGLTLEDVCSSTRGKLGKLGKFSDKDIQEKIKQHFPRSWPTMIAIAHAESRMRMDVVGYNCFYNNDMTVVYETRVKGSHSAACKPSHRKYAHSVDCFALQRNYKGQKCPEGVTIDEHLEDVAELSKVQGFKAWAAYNNKSYLKYLANN